MKFQKTAIAVTIAGFAAMPMMASADTVLSGVVQVKYTGIESDDDDAVEDVNMAAGDVRVAIATEHELNTGLIGYGNIQMNIDNLTGEGGSGQTEAIQIPQGDQAGTLTDLDPVELTTEATVAADNIYVGVKGGFGDVRFGEIPLAVEYGQLANDIHDVGTTVVDGVSYTGTFGPVGFGLNHSLAEDSDVIGAGIKFNFAGATIGAGFEDRDELTNFSIGASYAIAGFSLAAHAWSKGQVDFDTTEDADGDFSGIDFSSSLDDQTAFAVQVGYGIAGVSLGLTYSVLTTQDGAGVDDGEGTAVPGTNPTPTAGDGIVDRVTVGETEQQIVRFDAGYDLGGDMAISTRIQNTSDDDDGTEDVLEYRVMLSKSF